MVANTSKSAASPQPERAAADRGRWHRRWLSRLATAGLFLTFVAKKSWADTIGLTASALAFVTILSLVPLLAALSFVGARAFEQYQERAIEILVQILPYSEDLIIQRLNEFLAQAEQIRGFGLLGFILVSLLAFSTVDDALNRIWNVRSRRPFRVRLLSFTLLLFWGPLLIGAVYSSFLLLPDQPGFRTLLGNPVLAHALPPLATLVGLTTLYWLLPFTTVRFQSAVAGALAAAPLLEGLRHGFAFYARMVTTLDLDLVYGSFILAVFFMVSIQLAWGIVLLGSVVAYTAQNFHALRRTRRRAAPLPRAWIGLVALLVLTDRFRGGEPLCSHAQLATALAVPPAELQAALEPLLARRLLREARGSDADGYLLGQDPHLLTVREVLGLYDSARLDLALYLPPALARRLEALHQGLAAARGGFLADTTLAGLLAEAEAGGGAGAQS